MNQLFNVVLPGLAVITILLNVFFVFYRTHKIKNGITNADKGNFEKASRRTDSLTESNNKTRADTRFDKNVIGRLESDIDFAVEKFSPILEKLKSNITAPVFVNEYFPGNNFGKWIIVSILADLKYSVSAGVLSVRNDIFVYYIFVNKDCFTDEKLTLNGLMAITHEFCHFFSCFMTFLEMPGDLFMKRAKKLMNKKLSSTQNEESQRLYTILSSTAPRGSNDAPVLADNHFRSDFDNVTYSYTELYKKMLFHSEFMKTFDKGKRKVFYQMIKTRREKDAAEVYFECVNAFTEKTGLPGNFIMGQAQDLFIRLMANNKEALGGRRYN
jgi:hypothetical protein